MRDASHTRRYVNESYATSAGLISSSASAVYIGVDTTNIYPADGPGRPSVRLESKATFTHGLYVLDVAHMPIGCGVWPAFWSYGPGWPANGEIDVIEVCCFHGVS